MPSFFRWLLEAIQTGLQLAVLAPPLAAAFFVVSLAIRNSFSPHPEALDGGSLFGVLLAVVSGAYFLGGISAFAGGLALRFLSGSFPPILSSCFVGCIVVLTYSLTFGAHLAVGLNGFLGFLPYAIPAFLGSVVPAFYLARRIEA